MREFTVAQIQYSIAPWTAPLPSAATVGFSLYNGLLALPMHWFLAFLLASAGVVGMETSGGLMFTMAARSFVRKRWDVLVLAVIGAVIYVAIVVWTISITKDTRAIIGSVLVTLVTYLGVALYDYMRESDKAREDDERRKKEEADHAADLALKAAQAAKLESEARQREIDAQTRLENARTRQIKAAVGQAASSTGQPPLSTGHDGQKPPSLDPDILDAVVAYLRKFSNPEIVPLRTIESAALGVKKSAAKWYKAAALERIKQEDSNAA